jgi:hypothetical protein
MGLGGLGSESDSESDSEDEEVLASSSTSLSWPPSRWFGAPAAGAEHGDGVGPPTASSVPAGTAGSDEGVADSVRTRVGDTVGGWTPVLTGYRSRRTMVLGLRFLAAARGWGSSQGIVVRCLL